MKRLYIATGNAHKFGEFAALDRLHPCGLELHSAADLGGMPAVDESTGTFAGNALLKVEALRAIAPADDWVLADDSGLCVEALRGAPGVDSAVYAGKGAGDRANLEKLLGEIRRLRASRRSAQFFCILMALGPGGLHCASTGVCSGELLDHVRGKGGFGYDPIFVPAGGNRTFSELEEGEKHRISHRARAWAALAPRLRQLAGH